MFQRSMVRTMKGPSQSTPMFWSSLDCQAQGRYKVLGLYESVLTHLSWSAGHGGCDAILSADVARAAIGRAGTGARGAAACRVCR